MHSTREERGLTNLEPSRILERPFCHKKRVAVFVAFLRIE